MRKSVLVLTLIILSSSFFACRRSVPSDSAFKENFSIGRIVAESEQFLMPGSRALYASEYGSADDPFTQKKEEIALQIEQEELPAFNTALRAGVEESILDSGASIVGNGSGGVTGTSFSIQYREDEVFGVINLWGIRGEGTTFFLVVLITESTVLDPSSQHRPSLPQY